MFGENSDFRTFLIFHKIKINRCKNSYRTPIIYVQVVDFDFDKSTVKVILKKNLNF